MADDPRTSPDRPGVDLTVASEGVDLVPDPEVARRIEELEQANRALERHARALSHDLRAPIASTITGLRLLTQYGDRIGEGEREQIMARSLGRLNELVDQMDALLDEALLDGGRDVAPTDLGLALQWTLTTLDRFQAERLTLLIEDTPKVLARRVAVRQILQNVVSNSLGHNTGNVAVGLKGERVGDLVRIHLDDNGRGFPPDIDRLLEEGRSGSGSTGIGMASIALAVRRLGGGMDLGTSPTGGARVTLVFRAAPDDTPSSGDTGS